MAEHERKERPRPTRDAQADVERWIARTALLLDDVRREVRRSEGLLHAQGRRERAEGR